MEGVTSLCRTCLSDITVTERLLHSMFKDKLEPIPTRKSGHEGGVGERMPYSTSVQDTAPLRKRALGKAGRYSPGNMAFRRPYTEISVERTRSQKPKPSLGQHSCFLVGVSYCARWCIPMFRNADTTNICFFCVHRHPWTARWGSTCYRPALQTSPTGPCRHHTLCRGGSLTATGT